MNWSLRPLEELSDADFEQWKALLEERAGMQLTAQQRAYLQSQIGTRMRELKMTSCKDYLDYVQDGLQGNVEWNRLVDLVTVKETSFFRHPASFTFVTKYLQQRLARTDASQSIDLWSVGCATGEEAYSLAITAVEALEAAGRAPYFSVSATDISMHALAVGRKGEFSALRMQHVTDEQRARHFSAIDARRYRIADNLRQRVCFSPSNVMKVHDLPNISMDVIFCQNMLIYFRRWRRRDVLNALVERLKPGGILVIGLGEILEWDNPLVTRINNSSVQAYLRRS